MDAANSQKFYFFIGRTTPPHNGHITAISRAIELARASHTCALILLGNGPRGVRTRENPIEHETKAAFITHKLLELRYLEGTDFTIQMMENPPTGQVVEFVSKNIPENVSQISIFQVAGDKGDDVKKHEFVRTYTCKALIERFEGSKKVFNCGHVSVDPAKEGAAAEPKTDMSATKVRNKAVECYNMSDSDPNAAYQLWLQAFPFYNGGVETRRLSREIFEQIILHRDTPPPSASGSKTGKVKGSIVKTKSAKPDAPPKSRKNGKGGRGSRRIRKLRNKKTIRKNRR